MMTWIANIVGQLTEHDAIVRVTVIRAAGSTPREAGAAMLVGIVESLTATFYGPSWAPAVSFGFLLLTLAVRPAGLLGR